MTQYKNRKSAGKALVKFLTKYMDAEKTIVLALPRGGVPVAYEIARQLHLPLDVFLVRKLGVPGNEELAFGAIASGGGINFNEDIMAGYGLSQQEVDEVIAKEKLELERRSKLYFRDRNFPDLTNHTVILVDDGVATGATMIAAIKALKQYKLSRLVVAVPVAATIVHQTIKKIVDECICLNVEQDFLGVGSWYHDFRQITDQEVLDYLIKAHQ